MTTALIVVDMQIDFGSPTGSLYVTGSDRVLAEVNARIDAAVAAGSPVFYTQDWHPASTAHFAKDGGVWPVHCVGGTPGAAFLPGLRVAGPVVRKGTGGEDGYSGFAVRDPVTGAETPTELAALVEASGATAVDVVGLAGDYCVKETALDARKLGYDVRVPLAATAFVNLSPGDDDRAIAQLREAGVLVS